MNDILTSNTIALKSKATYLVTLFFLIDPLSDNFFPDTLSGKISPVKLPTSE